MTPPLIVSPWAAVRTLARFTLIETLRSRLFWLLGLVVLVAFVAAMLTESISLTESLDSRALVFGSLARLGTVFLLAVLIVTSLARETADRQLDFLLAGPCPRWAYGLGKAAGFALLGIGLAATVTLLALPLTSMSHYGTVAAWGGTLAVELLVVAALAMLTTFTFTQPATSLLALALMYGFARSADAVVSMAQYSVNMESTLSNQFQSWAANALSWLVPPLDRLADANMLTGASPDPAEMLWLCGLAAGYAVLYLVAALVDLSRKVL